MTLDDFEKIKENLITDFDEFWTPGILLSELKNENTKYIVLKEEIKIQKDVVDPDDVEMLQDLILTAVNDALNKVDEVTASEMKKFNLPNMPF